MRSSPIAAHEGADSSAICFLRRAGKPNPKIADESAPDPAALGGDFVRSLLRDRRGRLWVGIQSGGLNRYVDGGFETYLHDPDSPTSLINNDIWSLFEDRTGLIWIGTAGGGLNQINPSTRRFAGLRSLPFTPRSLRSPFVWELQEDADGRLWMATLAGLERWDPRDGSFALFEPRAGDKAMNPLQSLHKRQRRFNEQLSSAHSLAEARLQMARHYAETDQLTQLPNRSALLESLGRYMHAARQQRSVFAILLINLDRFQQINDAIGHALGDRVLQVTGERLQRCAGSGGYVARVGSDEFALIAPPPPSDAANGADDWPERLASEVQQVIGEPHPMRDPPMVIGACIGIACFDIASQDTPSDLLGHADIATHQGKQQGQGNVMRYRPGMHESLRARLSLQTRMQLALEAGEFVAWYQPLVGVVDGRLVGFEALIRWLPPDAPPIYPDQFIPLAEETGLIVELGDWMLREVCRQVGEWRQQGVAGISVAINVSMRQLRSGTLVSLLRGCLEQYRVPASMIKLEITESAMMENVEDAAEQLAEVRKLGVAVSVDDFGTGFSSLAHLKRLPVSELKIDRSFVSDVATSEQSRLIIASIVRMAHELKLGTVGEGVEDAASLACLRAIGCDIAQGYHFARPMSADRLWETGWLQPTRATPVVRRRA